MKTLIAALLLACSAFAQTNASASSLPSYLAGTGVSWNRYIANPLSEVTSLAARIGPNVYSWNTVDTPMASVNGVPQPSSVRAGAAYIAAQNANHSVFLALLGDIGLTATPSSTAAGYSAGAGVAIRIGKSNFYAMPMYRMIGAGSAVQAVPEFMLWYGFGQ